MRAPSFSTSRLWLTVWAWARRRAMLALQREWPDEFNQALARPTFGYTNQHALPVDDALHEARYYLGDWTRRKNVQSFSPRRALAKAAAEAREMHRLYPFTKTVSSAKNSARKRSGR